MILGVSMAQWFYIFEGAGVTILVSLFGFIGGIAFGLPLALMRSSKNVLLVKLSGLFIHSLQGIPLPVMMFLVYFGISILGTNLSALLSAAIAMTLYSSVFLGEIWKGCIQSISKEQWEAAECLSLSKVQVLRFVIFPQAFRMAIPPTVGFLVQIIKNSSYAVVIGLFELTYSAKVVNNSTFQPFVVFTVAALIYFVLCYPLASLSYHLERKLNKR